MANPRNRTGTQVSTLATHKQPSRAFWTIVGILVLFLIGCFVVFFIFGGQIPELSQELSTAPVDKTKGLMEKIKWREDLQNLSIGVLSSLIASIFLLFVLEFVIKNDDVEQLTRTIGRIQTLEQKKLTPLVERMEIVSSKLGHGVLAIKPRSTYGDDFWVDFISEADEEIVLAGKTLYNWLIVEKIKKSFCDNLVRILVQSQRSLVTLVIYSDNALQGIQAELDEKGELKRTLETDIFPEVAHRATKTVSSLKRRVNIIEVEALSHIHASNGKTMIVSHKLSSPNADASKKQKHLMLFLNMLIVKSSKLTLIIIKSL